MTAIDQVRRVYYDPAPVVRPLTARKRNQIWRVTGTLDELDDLAL